MEEKGDVGWLPAARRKRRKTRFRVKIKWMVRMQFVDGQ